jgi:hypothetical protein
MPSVLPVESTVVPAQVGVLAELADDPQVGHGVAGLPGVIGGRAEVGALRVKAVERGLEARRRRTLKPGARLLGELGVVGQVSPAGLVALGGRD